MEVAPQGVPKKVAVGRDRLADVHVRNRSKRKYGFGDLTAPTKREVLEFVEKEKEMTSARLAVLMKIKLNHASRLMRGYWSEGLLHREITTMRRGGIRYSFTLTRTGKRKLAYFRGKKI